LDALATMPELQSNEWVQSLLLRRQELYQAIAAQKPTHASGLRCRFHGDFHLGQVLVQSHDVQIIDFEGEMVRPQKGQDIKHSPLRDVAGMLRSFNYAALATATQLNEGVQQTKKLDAMLAVWERQTGAAFLQAYLDAIQDSGICPSNAADTQALIRLFVLEKALYEINYELNSRPHWLAFPIRGVLRVLDDIAALEPVSELAGDDSD
jgi:maltose alpha-D-glucosyltransferase/alpha-amylase